jgi:hypothetical protein
MSYIITLYDVASFLIRHHEEITLLNYYYTVFTLTYSSVKTTYQIGSYIADCIVPKNKQIEYKNEHTVTSVLIDNEEWINVDDDEINLP